MTRQIGDNHDKKKPHAHAEGAILGLDRHGVNQILLFGFLAGLNDQ